MSAPAKAPVAFFAFKRPAHTARTLEALAANLSAPATPLIVFCDGPRGPVDEAAVLAVRQLVREPRWAERFADLTIIESTTNAGLAAAVIGGVSRVINAHGRAIVLEDDLVSAPDFLCFMNACLDYYEPDRTIASIAGYSPLAILPRGVRGDVYALPRNGSHGWATWQDRWSAVDWQASAYDAFRTDRTARRRFNRAGADRGRRLDREVAGSGAGSWSVRFGFSQFLAGTLTVYPRDNRILNIGGDGTGEHGARGFRFNTTLCNRPQPFNLGPVKEDGRVVAAVAGLHNGGMARRLFHRLAALRPVGAPARARCQNHPADARILPDKM
ncbi:MAG: sugar transferase [Pseudomonadota bacterium]